MDANNVVMLLEQVLAGRKTPIQPMSIAAYAFLHSSVWLIAIAPFMPTPNFFDACSVQYLRDLINPINWCTRVHIYVSLLCVVGIM